MKAKVYGAFWGPLVAGLTTDLAILFVIIGWLCDVPALLVIGGSGFFLACSPALIAAPLAPLFGLYIASLPFILLFSKFRYKEKHPPNDNKPIRYCIYCDNALETRTGPRMFCPHCKRYVYDYN